MACYHPLKGWRAKTANPNGKRGVVFNRQHGFSDLPVTLPCGQCVGCRLEKSRQWAIRCQHEASLHEQNCFVTLTYSTDNLPPLGSLKLRDFQLFMKRLREEIAPKKVRFFHCGEYGEKYQRPHYHACLFGHDFDDKKPWKETNENILYTSETLTKLWGLGHCSIGAVTFQSAAYVARYIMKKATGELAEDRYLVVDENGEILGKRQPEYTTMSRRPGIGSDWLKKYKTDVYPDDFVVVNQKKMRPPKFYDNLFEQSDPHQHRTIKTERKQSTHKYKENNTPARLKVREKIQQKKLNLLPRNIE